MSLAVDLSFAFLLTIIWHRFFMGIGSTIRTDTHSPIAALAFAQSRRQPFVHPRRQRPTRT